MPQARTAARTADPSETDQQLREAEQEREKAEGLVMEMAAERESLNSRMNTLDGAMQTLLGEVRLTNEALGAIKDRQDLHSDAFNELTSRVTTLESGTETVPQRVSRETRKVANDSRNFARRAWDRTKRELKPGPVQHDHVKGLVVGNLVEYGALVGMAQIAPVAVMNGIASVLFV